METLWVGILISLISLLSGFAVNGIISLSKTKIELELLKQKQANHEALDGHPASLGQLATVKDHITEIKVNIANISTDVKWIKEEMINRNGTGRKHKEE